jgi:hypothetical protein
MTNLMKAAREWQSFDPDVNCTCGTHYNIKGLPLDDKYVCDRERAWRRYVKIRDTVVTKGQFDIKNNTEFVPNRLFTEFPNRKGQPLLQEEKGTES